MESGLEDSAIETVEMTGSVVAMAMMVVKNRWEDGICIGCFVVSIQFATSVLKRVVQVRVQKLFFWL